MNTLTDEQLKEIKRFNKNIEWLRKNQQSAPYENNFEDEVKIPEALKILGRGRTWLTTRMLTPEQVKQPMNTQWFLIRGIDWEREGSQLVFKRASLERLKQELRTLGVQYEQRLASK